MPLPEDEPPPEGKPLPEDGPLPEWQAAANQAIAEGRIGQGCLVYGLAMCIIGAVNVISGWHTDAPPLVPAAGLLLATCVYLIAAAFLMRFLAMRQAHFALIALGLLGGEWALVSYLLEAWFPYHYSGSIPDIAGSLGLVWLGVCSARKWVRWL